MKRILVYLKPYTRDSILAPLFKLTEALLVATAIALGAGMAITLSQILL